MGAEPQQIVVRRLDGPDELELALSLRVAVFCGEQGVSVAAERDGLDARAVQLGAFAGRELIGTCRLMEVDGELRAQRVVVRRDLRRSGVGRALMNAAEAQAQAWGHRVGGLALHAQLGSVGFYQRLGYIREGQPFVEEGIEHVTMRRELLS